MMLARVRVVSGASSRLMGRRCLSSKQPILVNERKEKQETNVPAAVPNSSQTLATPTTEQPAKLSLKDLATQYGPFIFLSYSFVWASTGVGMYLAINSIGPEAALEGMRHVGVDKLIDLDQIDPKVGTVAISILANELLEPIRLPIFLAAIRPACRRYDAWLISRGKSAGDSNSLMGKIRAFGTFGVVYYTGIWAGTGLLTFLGISVVGPEVVVDGLRNLGVERFVDLSRLNPAVGSVAIAVVLNELIEPIRLPLVLASIGPAKRAFDSLTTKV